MPYRIKNLGVPLFTTLTGTVKNLVIESVSISGNGGYTGAVACTANSAARIMATSTEADIWAPSKATPKSLSTVTL